jgi:CBS domain-containing protein
MKREVVCLSPEESVQVAARRMKAENVGFLPVCDAAKKVLGTLTDRDIALRVIAEGRTAATKCADVMTREVIACRPEDDLRKAQDLMTSNLKSRIMCTDASDKLVGVISLSDIVQTETAERATETMRGITLREAHA